MCFQAHTIVLKRQYEIDLPEYGEKVELEDHHRIYYIDHVRNGPKELKVILTEDSEGKFKLSINWKLSFRSGSCIIDE